VLLLLVLANALPSTTRDRLRGTDWQRAVCTAATSRNNPAPSFPNTPVIRRAEESRGIMLRCLEQ